MHLVQEKKQLMSIAQYAKNEISLNNKTYRESICLTSESLKPWNVTINQTLNIDDFLIFEQPELILLYSAKSNFQLPYDIHCQLSQKRIGIEVMNLGALCRTFNLLLQEGRCVAAGLIFSDS